jgi:hypothetical protein
LAGKEKAFEGKVPVNRFLRLNIKKRVAVKNKTDLFWKTNLPSTFVIL